MPKLCSCDGNEDHHTIKQTIAQTYENLKEFELNGYWAQQNVAPAKEKEAREKGKKGT